MAAQRSSSGRLGLIVGATALVVWVLWMTFARIKIYAVTEHARVEAIAFRVEAEVAGRVVQTQLKLGAQVEAGTVLVDLDSEPLILALAEKQALQRSLEAQVEALERQLNAAAALLAGRQRLASRRSREAKSQARGAQISARHAETEAARSALLYGERIETEADLSRTRADGLTRRVAAEVAARSVERIDAEGDMAETEIQLDVALLERQRAELQGQIAVTIAGVGTIVHQIEQRRVRAPANGRLGEVAMLQIGAVMAAGDEVATVVPPGDLRIAAQFAPATAIGRIRAGQPARLRLDGFPWTQYQSISATVVRVADEAREGYVRVELSVELDALPGMRLQHGLPGSVEVEVETLSPAEVVLRAAGALF
jgi:membrane fusion protein (multidrug efflux system)